MAALPNALPPRTQPNVRPSNIDEDSTILKIISYVPLIGVVASLYAKCSLDDKIQRTNNPARFVELVKVKNDYKLGDMGRCLILVVLDIAGIFAGTFAVRLVLSGILTFIAAEHYSGIEANRKVIAEVEANGLRNGLTIL